MPGVRSVFLTGSFVRGDWRDASSDLDINVLASNPAEGCAAARSVEQLLKSRSSRMTFPSQCPGGIDWGFHSSVPTESSDIDGSSPYPYFGVFYFDFLENVRVVWGEDFTVGLPEVNDARSLVAPSLRRTEQRLSADRSVTPRRAAYAAYKAAAMLQLFFGELTLDKRRIHGLYVRHVPEFRGKEMGDRIIRSYLTSSYPDHAPDFQDQKYYASFITACLKLVAS